MWGHLYPTAGFPLRPAADLRTAERCTRKAAPVDGTGSASRSLGQAEVLRELRRVFPDPLIELAQIARTLTADPPLDVWAAKWHLKELREVAALHAYYWAGTPAAANVLDLLTPPSALPVVLLRPRPGPVIAGEDSPPVEWSPPVIWQPLEQLDPENPLHPPVAHPDHESRDAFIARATDHYDKRAALLGTTPAHRRPALARHAEWFVLHVVAGRTIATIAADAFGPDGGNISTVTKGILQIRNLLHARIVN
jgi:hypothetical protein